MRKKKIVIQTNYANAKTGFGKNVKNLLTYLYKTEKYDLVNYATGMQESHPDFMRFPWKTRGCLPNNQVEINALNQDPHRARVASYGGYFIDKVIKEEKPDIWIGIEDPWGFPQYYEKPWYSKINSIISTTIDSLPLLPDAVKYAKNVKYFYVWSEFAEKAFHKLGDKFKHVKTLHGIIDISNFKKLPQHIKEELRRKNNINQDEFVGIFVFRNQLRKLVPNLLEGYKLFKQQNPQIKTKLILHTHIGEAGQGWDISRLIKENKLNPEEILSTYYCRNCHNWHLHKIVNVNDKNEYHNIVEKDCPFCGAKNGMISCNTHDGISETELCKLYNIADYYVHPFTSGGMEIPIFEAKCCELITLVTNYSCGEDACVPKARSLPLEWSRYFEAGTQFLKATTLPSSIAKQIKKVQSFSLKKRKEWGQEARNWVIDNYSTEVVGKKWEDLIDSLPFVDWNFNFEKEKKDPNYSIPHNSDDILWIKDLYKNILKMEVDDKDDGLLHWLNSLKNGLSRENIYQYFIKVAEDENKKNKKIDLNDLFDHPKEKRLLVVLKQSFGDHYLFTSLLDSIKQNYPNHFIYIAADQIYWPVYSGNQNVHKCIPYDNIMDSEIAMIGRSNQKGFVDKYMFPAVATQRFLNYLSNDQLGKVININK